MHSLLQRKQTSHPAFVRFWVSLILVLAGIQSVSAGLTVADIEAVYGDQYEVINVIPGRPWVEVQHRYDRDDVLISCNFVGGRCLWIDFWVEGGQTVNESLMFAQLDLLFPGDHWTPKLFHGRPRWWFNQEEDRVTLRVKGFSVHMNEYIRNVLSRREQWQF